MECTTCNARNETTQEERIGKANDVGDKFCVGYWPLYCVYVCIGFGGKQ